MEKALRQVSRGLERQAPVEQPAFVFPVVDEPRATLLPRASLRDVLLRKSPLVGARCDEAGLRGFLSPAEARILLGIDYADAVAIERAYQPSLGRNLGTAFRTAVASLLAPRGDVRRERRPFIVSSRVDAITRKQALQAIVTPLATRAKMVFFAHPHALNLARFDPALAKHLERADLVLPDGIGIRLAAQLLGLSLPHNLNGTDMLPPICEEAARLGIPIALVGGKPGVAAACSERLCAQIPGLKIPFVADGYLDDRESALVVKQLRRMGRCIVLIGMGTPIQEKWAMEHLADLKGVTAVTVGGLFDFFAGRVERAPIAWRELGLEWLFRLIKEPRRMARRYLVGNPLFLMLALIQRWRTGNR